MPTDQWFGRQFLDSNAALGNDRIRGSSLINLVTGGTCVCLQTKSSVQYRFELILRFDF